VVHSKWQFGRDNAGCLDAASSIFTVVNLFMLFLLNLKGIARIAFWCQCNIDYFNPNRPSKRDSSRFFLKSGYHRSDWLP
jgi:hypothetical protein